MAYQSTFTGEQMEAVFRRVSNMITGSAELTASNDGHGYVFVNDLHFSGSNPKIFTTVRGINGDITGTAGAAPSYNAEAGMLLLQLFGDGILDGETYAIDYLMIE